MGHGKKKIVLTGLLGSVRSGSYTALSLSLAKKHAEKRLESSLDIIDPANLEFPLPGKGASDDAAMMQQKVKNAHAVILATPEYHGSYSSVIKLLIENMGFPSALKGKPVALLGVASGRIGAIKALEHLRSVASHVGAVVLPGPVSIAEVRSKFDADGQVIDKDCESRIEKLVDNLIEYVEKHTCPEETLEDFVRS